VIIGYLIPAGSGTYRYTEIDIEPPEGYEPPPPAPEGAALPAAAQVPAGILADDEL
jgi:hypothetical protein